jgi:hypothetical protein
MPTNLDSVKPKDRCTYSVYGLLAAGMRFTYDYTEEDAVRDYLELHPDAKEADVRDELAAEIKKYGG